MNFGKASLLLLSSLGRVGSRDVPSGAVDEKGVAGEYQRWCKRSGLLFFAYLCQYFQKQSGVDL